jgi:hypothetical protein
MWSMCTALTELTSNGELEDLKWVSLTTADTLDLPIATQYVIGELETWLKDPARPIRFLAARAPVRRWKPMSARPINMAALFLADPHSRQIALVRTDTGYRAPQARPVRAAMAWRSLAVR